jgi:hypothetical protein
MVILAFRFSCLETDLFCGVNRRYAFLGMPRSESACV